MRATNYIDRFRPKLPSMATLSGSAGDLGHSTADLVFANYRELVHPDEG